MYDDIASVYHLIYEDWDAAMERQARAFNKVFLNYFAEGTLDILDVSCGIGTQALGLAALGHRVTGSDLAAGAVARAREEARLRNLEIDLMTADMREAFAVHGSGFDIVLSADNALPHLPNHHEVELALTSFLACLTGGGVAVIGVRDYPDDEPRTTGQVWPYGFRYMNGERYYVFQTRDWAGSSYQVGMYFVKEALHKSEAKVVAGLSTYYAISTQEVMALMLKVGFKDVVQLDHLSQPVIVGKKPLEMPRR